MRRNRASTPLPRGIGRFWQSSTFRLSLFYTAVFAVSAIAILAFVYGRTAQSLDEQVDEAVTAEALSLNQNFTELGLTGLVDAVENRMDPERSGDDVYLVLDAQGQIKTGNLPEWPAATPDANGWIGFEVQRDYDETPHRIRAKVLALPGQVMLLVGRDLRAHTEFQGLMTDAILSALAISLVLGIGGGVVTTRAMLRRIDGIRRGADRIIEGDMAHRMALKGTGDEFDRLAETLNTMLDAIERLMGAMRTVTHNIAHDLRSPLTRVKTRLELALMQQGNQAGQREAIVQSIADADSLIATFNALLSIASAEAGATEAEMAPVDMDALAADMVELYEPIAEEQGVVLRAENEGAGQGGGCILGNRQLLGQALTNLVDNALKYAADGGEITVSTTRRGETLVLGVADRGRGIAAEDRTRVLDRFVRLEASRSTPGNGLGLSLVAAIVRLHKGRVVLADNEPGLKVELSFPALPERALAA